MSGLRVEVGGRILKDAVSFQLSKGEVLKLSGPNGSGKTTLMRQLLGLTATNAGQTRYGFGFRLGSTVSYLPQNSSDTLLPWFSGLQNLGLGLANAHDKQAPRGWAELMRAFFPTADDTPSCAYFLASRPVSRLSGGERQKIAILRTFLSSPLLVCLDEPYRELDFTSCCALRDFLARYVDSRAGALVLTSHHDVGPAPSLSVTLP